MRSLGFDISREVNVAGTAFCCECNLCSYYSCPEDLDPKNVCAENKGRLIAEKKRWENPPFNPDRPKQHMANRKAPTRRLMQKLNVTGFRDAGPMREGTLETDSVGVNLKQHIGAPCQPAVAVGDRVARGQVVGRVPVTDGKPALGAPVHASIDGVVKSIADGVVRIDRN